MKNIGFKFVGSYLPGKRVSYLLAIIIGLGLVVAGLYWCTILLLIMSGYITGMKKILKKRKNTYVSIFFFFITAFIFALTIRLLLFGITFVPSESMKNTVIPGDFILINKLAYGPVLPSSPDAIPYLNLVLKNHRDSLKVDSNRWGYVRLSGYSHIKKNEIIIFNKPGQENISLVKRCVGMPGETIAIKNATVYTNGRANDADKFILQKYKLWVKDPNLLFKLKYKSHLDLSPHNEGSKEWMEGLLTTQQKEALQNSGAVDSISYFPAGKAHPTVFDAYKYSDWTLNNFGPILIPAKNMTISFTRENYSYYKPLLENYEHISTFTYNNKFYLNGRLASSYKFKNNYFFVMGDNRYDSVDSRFWGLLPEQSIEGKASLILFSFDAGDGINWFRLFKLL